MIRMDIKAVCSLIDERKEELFELLSSLIKINSENFGSYGNEEEIANYIEKLCLEMELETDKFSPLEIPDFENHPDYFPGRNLENRYSVVASLKGKEDKNCLMLMAHNDTVAIGDTEKWNIDPLGGIIRDGKIYGRGACDDKYAIATCLFVIKLLKEHGFIPKQNLLMAAYSDEEYGGSHGALSCVLKYPCEHIVSMDGRNREIWNCASGGQEAEYHFHATTSTGTSETCARAIPIVMDCIKEFGKRRYEELEANKYYKGTDIPKSSLRFLDVSVGHGGTNLESAKVGFEYYTDKTKEEIFKEYEELEGIISGKLAPFGITGDGIKPTTRFFHYVSCEPDSDDIKLMQEASKEATGIDVNVYPSCQSDYSVILKYGSPKAFAFGNGKAFQQEGGAHQANEYMECDRLVEYAKTIAAFIIKLLG